MKLKIIFIILILGTTVTNKTFAQTIEGEWYTSLRNKLLHIIISKDSITFRKCSFDSTMRDYGYVMMAFKVVKQIKTNYIVSSIKDSILTYYLIKFNLENGRNNLNVESLNNKYQNITDAENAIPNFEQQRLNIILLKKQEIEKIRQGKDIGTMNTNDFKIYASKIIEIDTKNKDYIKQKYKLAHLYAESTGRIILSDIGFNSLVKGDLFDSMLEKFSEHPETKEIFIKMTRSEK